MLRTGHLAHLLTHGQFTVTPATVVAKFGNGSIPRTSENCVDQAGWLWWDLVGKPAPPMDTCLVDRLEWRLANAGSVGVARVAGPAGSGKSFAVMQLACKKFVDILDAGKRNGIGRELFLELRRCIDNVGMYVDTEVLLRRGESIANVSKALLSSRWAQYLVWVLMHTLTALRSVCATPRDWLFLQRYHGSEISQAYRCALKHASDVKMSYNVLRAIPPETIPFALIVDEAVGALVAGPCHVSDAWRGVGVGAGTESVGTGCAGTLDSPTSRCGTKDEPFVGMLGCIRSALRMYRGIVLATLETAYSFPHDSTKHRLGAMPPRNAFWRSAWSPYIDVSCFPYFTPAFCRKHVTFYINLFRPNTTRPEDIDDLCNELQGELVSLTTL